jgi:hypothetical protein
VRQAPWRRRDRRRTARRSLPTSEHDAVIAASVAGKHGAPTSGDCRTMT